MDTHTHARTHAHTHTHTHTHTHAHTHTHTHTSTYTSRTKVISRNPACTQFKTKEGKNCLGGNFLKCSPEFNVALKNDNAFGVAWNCILYLEKYYIFYIYG